MFVAILMRHLTPFVFIAYTWNTSGTCTFITFIRYTIWIFQKFSTSSPPTKKFKKKMELKMFHTELSDADLVDGVELDCASQKRDFSPGVSNLFETTSLIKVFKDVEFVGTLMYLFFFFVWCSILRDLSWGSSLFSHLGCCLDAASNHETTKASENCRKTCISRHTDTILWDP